MATKQKLRETTMSIECRVGTPHELEIKRCSTPSSAKTFVLGRLVAREKWAKHYNLALAEKLAAFRLDFDNLDLRTLKAGAERTWEFLDETTGVRFRYEIKVLST